MEQVEAHSRRLIVTLPAVSVKSTVFQFQQGDVLYGRLRPYLNKVLCATFEGLCSSEFIVLPPGDGFIPEYLAAYLNTQCFVEFANQLNQGDRPRVSFDQISGHPIPLPPLAEQRRIVAKLEVLLGTVDACRARLDRIPALLKRFRQSVLAAACSGRLTADWREDSVSGEEELPDGWRFGKLDDVLEGLKYGTAHRSEYGVKGHPILRIPNIGDGVLDLADMKYASLSKEEYAQLKVKDGDLLMIRSNGSRSLVGKTAIVRKGEAGHAYAGYLIRLRIDPRRAHPEFINLALASQPVRDQIEIPLRSTSGVNNINSTEVRSLTVPCVPLAEQKEIVRRVEALFAVADQIEERYAKAKEYVDRLTQAILAKAFRGELVPQDSTDEPASVLLERIRAAQGQDSHSPSGGRRKGEDQIPVGASPRVQEGPAQQGGKRGRASASVKAALPPSRWKEGESPRRGRPPKAAARVGAKALSPRGRKVVLPHARQDVVPSGGSDVSLSRTARAVLKRMKPGRDYGRADLAGPLDLSPSEWTAAIRELKEGGHVLQEGDRRGARYRLTQE